MLGKRYSVLMLLLIVGYGLVRCDTIHDIHQPEIRFIHPEQGKTYMGDSPVSIPVEIEFSDKGGLHSLTLIIDGEELYDDEIVSSWTGGNVSWIGQTGEEAIWIDTLLCSDNSDTVHQISIRVEDDSRNWIKDSVSFYHHTSSLIYWR
jgi:hypothetical protein